MGKYKFKNRKLPKEFSKVISYINDIKGVTVSLGSSTEFLGHFNRQIIIHHNYDLKNNGLFALLHEVGHVLQPPNNIGINAYKNIDKTQHPVEYQMGRFLCELDAWERGYYIAKQLAININDTEWKIEKQKALLTYFK